MSRNYFKGSIRFKGNIIFGKVTRGFELRGHKKVLKASYLFSLLLIFKNIEKYLKGVQQPIKINFKNSFFFILISLNGLMVDASADKRVITLTLLENHCEIRL